MGLIIQIVILSTLILILVTLVGDEKRLKVIRSSSGKMTGYWNGKERRESVRISSILITRYSVEKRPHPKKNSHSKNISNGGILIELKEKLPLATALLLEICMPNEPKPISAEGEVVWAKELDHMDEEGRKLFDTGIKFILMNPQDKERLDKHIKDSISSPS